MGLRMVGLVLLFICCYMLGVETELYFKRQWELWTELKEALVYLEKEMSCHRSTLPEALRCAAKGRMAPVKNFLVQVSIAAEMRDGRSLDEIWKRTFRREIPEKILRGDRTVIEEAAAAICAHDVTMQKTMFCRCVCHIEEEIRQAYEIWQEKGKLYRRLSVTGGAFLMIVLF